MTTTKPQQIIIVILFYDGNVKYQGEVARTKTEQAQKKLGFWLVT
jgi:hypothetical protein